MPQYFILHVGTTLYILNSKLVVTNTYRVIIFFNNTILYVIRAIYFLKKSPGTFPNIEVSLKIVLTVSVNSARKKISLLLYQRYIIENKLFKNINVFIYKHIAGYILNVYLGNII